MKHKDKLYLHIMRSPCELITNNAQHTRVFGESNTVKSNYREHTTQRLKLSCILNFHC